ncbi:hypothetical protein B9G54_00395 [Alloscardovia macacae]|uniref:MFS transporter n=1 Tax=Alloscardovia macacae TaxID=1160091 RepID=UPI000A2D9EDE|nr:MFS transporter [Alloscardovia macacae]OTA27568.1 hypothetical protein B9G54_00395 [Alloscardovia macacae]
MEEHALPEPRTDHADAYEASDVISNEPARMKTGWIAAFLILAGLIMRAPIVVLPLYIEPMSREMGRDPGSFGILTSLPLLMFVLVSLIVPWLADKLNLTRTLQLGMWLIVVGSLMRLLVTWNTMLVATGLIGAGIAILNIGMPTLVTEVFSEKPGLYTTSYSTGLVFGSVLLVFIDPLITAAFGWRAGIWVMAGMALIPALISMMMPQIRVAGSGADASPQTGSRTENRSGAKLRFLRDIRTWLFVGMFAGQAFLSYTLSAWLPVMLGASHITGVHYTGIMVLFNLAGLPASLIIPMFLARTKRVYHLWFVVWVTLVQAAVVALYPVRPMDALWGPVYWYVFGGVSCFFFTAIFVMVLTFYPLKAATSADAADLSGLSQSLGYLIAAAGPLLYGFVYGGQHMPGVSFAWGMTLVVLLNAWCAWHVVRINKFGLETLR